MSHSDLGGGEHLLPSITKTILTATMKMLSFVNLIITYIWTAPKFSLLPSHEP